MKDITQDNIPYNLKILGRISRINGQSNSIKNVILDSLTSTIKCTPPGGFGFEKGLYRFRVSVIGYKDTVISVQAEYNQITTASNSDGLQASGGTKIALKMNPL